MPSRARRRAAPETRRCSPAIEPGTYGASASLAVGFISLSNCIGYVLRLYALEHASATRVTVFLTLGPATANLLDAVFLAEPVSATLVEGLGCVAVGLVAANWKMPTA